MKITKLFLCGVLGLFFLNSCSSDDVTNPTPEVLPVDKDYADGFFVLNEGGIGTVTFISDDLERVEQEIYATVNEGDDIGGYVQSIFFTDELALIISNGSNLITVVDRYTFELVGKVESGLEVPMFGVAIDGKAYVSNLASFDSTTDDYLAVIDLETFKVEQTILINDYAHYLTEENALIYIKNSSYGTGNNVSVFNPSTNAVERKVEVGEGLNSIRVEDNHLYALSSTKIEIIDLENDELVSEIIFTEDHGGARNLDVEEGNIYYTIGTSVYSVAIDATEPAESALVDYSSSSDYGVMYGFEVEDDRFFIADGGDFSSNSFVEVYTTAGEFLKKIEVGVGPNGFYFNED